MLEIECSMTCGQGWPVDPCIKMSKEKCGLGGTIMDKRSETNAGRIRKMTDEELAYILAGQCSCCAYQTLPERCAGSLCREGILEWLKRKCKDA